MTGGHYYVAMWRDGVTEEYAIPARHGSIAAIEAVEEMCPGWSYIGVTWRARFEYRVLPSNCQPSYSQLNVEQERVPLFHVPQESNV